MFVSCTALLHSDCRATCGVALCSLCDLICIFYTKYSWKSGEELRQEKRVDQ